MSYTDAELDLYERTFERAAVLLDEDGYFSFIQTIDPDCVIEQAISARNDLIERRRRAALTDAERAVEDARNQRLVQVGMTIVRTIIAKRKHENALELEAPGR